MRGNLTKKENSTFAKILKEYQSGQNNRGGNLAEFDDKLELQESYILHIKKYWTNYLGLQSTPHLWESYHKKYGDYENFDTEQYEKYHHEAAQIPYDESNKQENYYMKQIAKGIDIDDNSLGGKYHCCPFCPFDLSNPDCWFMDWKVMRVIHKEDGKLVNKLNDEGVQRMNDLKEKMRLEQEESEPSKKKLKENQIGLENG